jgi:hypothetical protein
MKWNIVIIVGLFILSCSQSNSIDKKQAEKNLINQVNTAGKYLLHKDYEAYVDYIYPAIVKETGGKEAIIRIIRNQMKNFELDGITITELKFGIPSPIIEEPNGELQAVITQSHTMRKGDEKISPDGALVAVSTDKGKNWKFIDVADKDGVGLRRQYPNLSGKLPIPDLRD